MRRMDPESNENKFKQFREALRAAESACYTKICQEHGLDGDNLSYDGIISLFWRMAKRRFKEIKAGGN